MPSLQIINEFTTNIGFLSIGPGLDALKYLQTAGDTKYQETGSLRAFAILHVPPVQWLVSCTCAIHYDFLLVGHENGLNCRIHIDFGVGMERTIRDNIWREECRA